MYQLRHTYFTIETFAMSIAVNFWLFEYVSILLTYDTQLVVCKCARVRAYLGIKIYVAARAGTLTPPSPTTPTNVLRRQAERVPSISAGNTNSAGLHHAIQLASLSHFANLLRSFSECR